VRQREKVDWFFWDGGFSMLRFRERLTLRAVSAAMLLALCFAILPGSVGAKAASPTFYYLSLGDSLAYGIDVPRMLSEVAAGNFDPTTFNQGYTDLIAARLRTFSSGIQVVNYGCPGTTPDVFMYAPCGFAYPLHNAFSGTQMDAALAFIAAHPGQIALITLDLDVFEPEMGQMVTYCNFAPACVAQYLPTALAYLKARLDTLFARLHAAAPNVKVVVNSMYNPYSTLAPWTDTVILGGNNVLIASAHSAGLVVADMYPAFDPAANRAVTLCTLLYLCLASHDVHPTPAGYVAMASTMWASTGWPLTP
jgi:hypothetical protein